MLMKPTAPLRSNFSVFATTLCRGLSLSRGLFYAASLIHMKIKAAAIRQGGRMVATGLSHEAAKLSAGGLTGEHGFITDTGRFVNRRQAGGIALMSGQAKELSNPSLGLSSTDLEHDYPISD